MDSIKQALLIPYFRARALYPVWFSVINREGRALFGQNQEELSDVQQRILNDVQKDGITTATLDELFPGENMLEKLQAKEQELAPSAETYERKDYMKTYWEKVPELDLDNPFVKVATHPTVIGIANAYMQLFTRLKFYQLEKTMPRGEEVERTHSQRWHRDPNEPKYMKMFIYLNDVDDTSGPFVYIPGSTRGNKYGHLFPQKPPKGSYPPDGELEKQIPEEEWFTATAKAGTVIFCDTTGLHRGGYATHGERIMFTCLFAADSYAKDTSYTMDSDTRERIKDMTPAQQYALLKA